MKVIRRTNREIQQRRGLLQLQCRNGCGTTVIITSTPADKTVVLDDHSHNDFVINENDQAVWVGEGGDYGFHRCPLYAEAY